MTCKCEEGTWGTPNKSPICRNPVYTEGVLCLNCAHDKECHETETIEADMQGAKRLYLKQGEIEWLIAFIMSGRKPEQLIGHEKKIYDKLVIAKNKESTVQNRESRHGKLR